MKYINKYLRNIKPYANASHKIWRVSPSEREKIIKLDWNESPSAPSPRVEYRIRTILDSSCIFNYYPETANENIVKQLSSYLSINSCNIQYFGGSDALHEYIARIYLSPGDPVLILGPSYDNFRLTCQSSGADVRHSDFGLNFTFSENNFIADIDRNSPALVYICNPNNPTGYLHDVKFIEYLVSKYSDTMFVVDEAYSEYSKISAKGLVGKYDNILITRTMSKAFGLANFRFGYLIASADNVRMVSKIRNPKNVSTFAQEAALGVLEDVSYMEAHVESTISNRDVFISKIKDQFQHLHPYSSSGNFVLIDTKSQENRNKICMKLAEKNIFVRELNHHPMLQQTFRVTIGTKSQMNQLVAELKTIDLK
jgi:histidinol-phosphate aminotransferase